MTIVPSSPGTILGLGGICAFLQNAKTVRVWVECPHSMTELDIYWLPLEFPLNQYPLGYNVYRLHVPQLNLQAPNGVKLNATLVTVPMYRDLTVDLTRKDHYYYAVTAVFADDTEIPLSEPVTLEQYVNFMGRPSRGISMPRVMAEYRRRKWLILRETAEYAEILIRRRSGVRCSCVSCTFETTTNSNCPLCFGTGFDRGYDLLKQVLVRHIPMQQVVKLQPQGLVYQATPKGWLVDFPLLRNGDLICRRNGERLEVNNVTYMEHQGILTHQDFDLLSIPATSAVYQYDLINDEPLAV